MSRSDAWLTRCLAGFPRVSGDEPTIGTTNAKALTFSPRERG